MSTTKPLTTTKVAAYCHVSHAAICNWIKAKKLKAYRTPGGLYRIEPRVLVEFMERHGMPVSAELRGPSKQVILVVDDDAEIVSAVRRILGEDGAGYTVEGATDGFSAGQMVQSLQPGLILLDIRMPGMDGFKVLEQLKSEPTTKDIKVLILTGYATDENVARFQEIGVDGWMEKPLDFDALKKNVAEFIGEPTPR